MKINLKKAALLITGVLLGGSVFAQTSDTETSTEYVKPFSGIDSYRTWSIGANLGAPSLLLATGGHNGFDHWTPTLGWGISLRDQVVHAFGIQFDYNGGMVKGGVRGNQPYVTDIYGQHYTSFSTNYSQFSLSGVLNVATVNYLRRKNAVSFYLNSGVGVVYYTPTVYGAVTPGITTTTSASFNTSNLVIPVGAGFKFRVADPIALNFGYNENFIDGSSFNGANQYPVMSHYAYGYAGIEYTFGQKSKPSIEWANPIASIHDEYTMEEIRLQKQLDAQKAMNAKLRADMDAMNANLAKYTTDSDNDGVADFFDKCPGTPAGVKVDGSGCPLPVVVIPPAVVAPKPDVKVYITEEDRKIVKEAIKNLEFDFNKATIRPHSFPSLNRVAQLLVEKNFSLKLAGHTDNVGSDDYNLKLSKNRAESVKNYLVSKGANPSTIEATGYGKNQPIATNKTAKGRQMNRRVEFTLF